MFWCNSSINCQPCFSPKVCNQALTSRKPVPDEAGLGITILPLYSGLVRSCQLTGLVSPCFSASMVLKQMVAAHTSIPTQAGGLAVSR